MTVVDLNATAPRRRGVRLTSGSAFRRAFEAEFDVSSDPGSRALLEQAVICLDRIRELEQLVAVVGPAVAGSKGQLRSNPLLAEIRAERESFSRLLRDLEPEPPRKPVGGRPLGSYSNARKR